MYGVSWKSFVQLFKCYLVLCLNPLYFSNVLSQDKILAPNVLLGPDFHLNCTIHVLWSMWIYPSHKWQFENDSTFIRYYEAMFWKIWTQQRRTSSVHNFDLLAFSREFTEVLHLHTYTQCYSTVFFLSASCDYTKHKSFHIFILLHCELWINLDNY